MDRARQNFLLLGSFPPKGENHSNIVTTYAGPGVVAGLFSLIAFCVLVIDAAFFEWSRTVSAPIREFFGAITEAGDSGFYLIPCGVLLLVLLFTNYTLISQQAQSIAGSVVARGVFIFTAIAAPSLVITIVKRIIGRARPKHYDSEGVWSLEPIAFDASYAAFPSGHSTTIAAVAVAFALFVPGRWRMVIFLAAGWVALSRAVIGAHYLSDVIIGVICGGTGALLVALYFARRGLVFTLDEKGIPHAQSLADRSATISAFAELLSTLFRQVPVSNAQKKDPS